MSALPGRSEPKRSFGGCARPGLIPTPIRKLVGKPVRQPLANLGRGSPPKGGPQRVSLLRRKIGGPSAILSGSLSRKLVRNPFPHDGADGCPLLRRELGKPSEDGRGSRPTPVHS